MERHKIISNLVFLLMVCQTVTDTLNTSTTHTSIMDGHGFVPSTIVPATLTEPWPSDTALQTSQSPTADHNSSLLTDSDQPLSSTISTAHNKDCRHRAAEVGHTTGVIIVTMKPERPKSRQWTIHLPCPEDGMVLTFNNITEPLDAMLWITAVGGLADIGGFAEIYTSPSTAETFPVLVESNRAIVNHYSRGTRHGSLVITYTSHPKDKMPRKVHMSGIVEFYNCSGDVLIPSVLRCNMVQECVDNEDEDDCDYTHQGCGDWVPYRDKCFKLLFIRRLGALTSMRLADSKEKEKVCHTRYDAQLAILKDSGDLTFVGRIMRQTGYRRAIIGLKRVKPASRRLRHLYRYLWQWGDTGNPIEYFFHNSDDAASKEYSQLKVTFTSTSIEVEKDWPNGFICMKDRPFHIEVTADTPLSVHLSRPTRQITRFPTRTCADGFLVQKFHLCYQGNKQDMMAWSSYNFALFPCRYGPPVHYTVVCDGNGDCQDRSDETECAAVVFPPLRDAMFTCKNLQLISKDKQCDGKYDCFDESDENCCAFCTKPHHCTVKCAPAKYKRNLGSLCHNSVNGPSYDTPISTCHSTPCLVTLDGFGMAALQPASDTNTEGTFRCKDGDYYIPSFLLNNGEQDCRSGEDENIPPENITCPAFYRCQYSYSCVHPDHVCDGIYHCPYKDDERYCHIVCPDQCQCEGYAFSCTHFSNFSQVLLARYLDLSGSRNVSLRSLHFLELLQFLNMSHCGLDLVHITNMPQLQILDLSFNHMKHIHSFVFKQLSGLKYLDVSDNPLVQVLDASFGTFMKLSGSTRLKSLAMRHTGVQSIKDSAFSPLTVLQTLDIRDNFITVYDREMFRGLNSLQVLYTDYSKLCCPYFHDSRVINCVAPFDELSSCNDMLRQNIFRVFLWLVAVLAIVGNAGVLLYRLYAVNQHNMSAFHLLVISLCCADFFMGMYVTVIGIADAQFQGEYVVKEAAWKRSVVCKMAGFLGFVSSEASAMTVCLITLDRVLVLCFPLKSHFHLTVCSCLATCGVLWFVVVTLAALPLMAGLEFYGVSSICLPLPITRHQFSGQVYSFGIFIVFNFVLCILIGLGQVLIFHAIRSVSKATGTSRRPQEMTIARRLFLVVLSDFCCWFPIGFMGLLATQGMPISDEVNVWTAIFILPLNSVLNPFLYTLNTFLEKWRAENQKKETSKILGNIESRLQHMLPSTAEEIVRSCIRSNVVKREKILQMLQLHD